MHISEFWNYYFKLLPILICVLVLFSLFFLLLFLFIYFFVLALIYEREQPAEW